MDTTERLPWVNYLEGDCIGKETPGGMRVYQVVVRIRGEGLMAVVKARAGDEYFVAFAGGSSFASLAAKVRDLVLKGEEKFKVDSYPPA